MIQSEVSNTVLDSPLHGIVVLFFYSKAKLSCVYVYIVVKCDIIIAISQLEQSSCLMAWVNLGIPS